MNARGKILTDFENFKAKFEKFLENQEIIVTIQSKENISAIDYFSEKIDGDWTDFFWEHKEDNIIDYPFMRYFYYITEMLFFLDKEDDDLTQSPFSYDSYTKNPKLNFGLIKKVYDSKKNIEFLFNSLNNINNIENISSTIFTDERYTDGKIALFSKKTDLFKRCIENDEFDLYEKILLFTIISFINKYYNFKVINESNENLLDLVRVVRNFLLKVRWQEYIEFRSNLRYRFLSDQLSFIFDNLILDINCYEILSSENMQGKRFRGAIKGAFDSEVSKAKFVLGHQDLKYHIFRLEDHELLQGSIHNFDIENNANNLIEFVESFVEIWGKNEDSKIARSLLTIDDYSLEIGWSSLGYRYYFGNDNKCIVILTTYENDGLERILPNYLKSYASNNNNLDKMIDEYINNTDEKDWKYYFIKYDEMVSSDNNLYSMEDDDFKIRNLTKSRLSGWHINPFVRTVAKMINNEDICDLNDCYSKSAWESPLKLKNGVELYCDNNGWKIKLPEDMVPPDEVTSKYGIELKYLKPSDEMDMIEIAVDFSKMINS